MNLARPFIRRPIASIFLAVAVVLLGLLAWRMLPVAPLPQVDFPTIRVSANLPGASPESMAATVATPLERALGSIAGVTRISSSSNQGSTDVRLEFALDRNIDDAARDVQAAINAARGQLPAGMRENPSFRKINPSQAPIMGLALSSPNLSSSELYDAASTILAQKLSQIVGVGEVSVGGASLPAVRVQLHPSALAHRGVALDEVRTALADNSAVTPLGYIEDGGRRMQVQIGEPPRRAADFQSLVVRWRDGAPIRLSDVAEVSDSVENRYSSGFHNDRPAVILMVSRRSGANIVQTIDAINAQLPQLRALMPADAELSIVMDRSPGIRATLSEAQLTLLISSGLVVLVVWLFLGRLRAALIPSIAIPVSLIGSFAVMYVYGFSLNNLSLMALIVAAGLVVDDAIVVLENIERHIARGLSPYRAAMRGAGEVGFTLLAMNLALVVVFVSILFMGGVVERLFREFSITLAADMLISLAVSLTLTPSLCAHWLQHGAAAAPGRFARASAAMFDRLQAAYARSLVWVLRHGILTMLVLAAVTALNVYLYIEIPKGMLPKQDTGQMSAFVRGDDGFSFQVMQPKIEVYRRLLLADPAVRDVVGTSGGSGGLSNSMMRVRLKPLSQRGEPGQAVVDRLQRNAPPIPGGMLIPFLDQDVRFGSSFGNNSQEVMLLSDDLTALRTWSRRVADALRQAPELANVNAEVGEAAQQIVLNIDREAAQRLGVDMRMITSVLNNSFSQRQVATLYDPLNQYRVVMELTPRFTGRPDALREVQVVTSTGSRVPLSAFATYRYGLVDDRVSHENQFASASVGYELAPGVGTQQALLAIDRAMAGVMLPANIHTQAGGDAGGLSNIVQAQPLLILGVLVAVYLVLGVLYESTLHPLTILSTLPPAGVGALLALRATQTEFSLIALLGLFLLIGIVMKNAILMIDFALAAQRREGLGAQAAITRAASLRLRPILMTNIAALLGALPLVLGMGEGSELRRPLGVAIVGGLLVSQLLTLYTTPVVYLYLERLRQWGLRRVAPKAMPQQ